MLDGTLALTTSWFLDWRGSTRWSTGRTESTSETTGRGGEGESLTKPPSPPKETLSLWWRIPSASTSLPVMAISEESSRHDSTGRFEAQIPGSQASLRHLGIVWRVLWWRSLGVHHASNRRIGSQGRSEAGPGSVTTERLQPRGDLVPLYPRCCQIWEDFDSVDFLGNSRLQAMTRALETYDFRIPHPLSSHFFCCVGQYVWETVKCDTRKKSASWEMSSSREASLDWQPAYENNFVLQSWDVEGCTDDGALNPLGPKLVIN